MRFLHWTKATVEPGRPPERRSLHWSLRNVLLVAEIFGLLPVGGIRAPTAYGLEFAWLSLRVLYNVLVLLGTSTMGMLAVLRLFDQGFSFHKSTGVIFFMCAILTTSLFVKLACNWPRLMQQWALAEVQLKHYDSGRDLHRRIAILAVVIGILATVEHVLSITSAVVSARSCRTSGDAIQAYNEVKFSHVFAYTNYTIWKGVIVQFLNLLCTFSWNFMDLFIMIMSMALTELFARISTKMQAIQHQVTHESVWRQLREDYNRVCGLCRALNDTISDIVFLSFASNLYFICAQLLYSIKPMDHMYNTIYFFYSMIYLMVRTLAVTLIAARIHEESRVPLQTLFSVPGYSYCAEMGRFVQQIGTEIVALTGMNFFAVRRGIVLTVAGTIVTYELVLVQFHVDEDPTISNKTGVILPCLSLPR